jgi:hypothetical protein
MLILWVQLLAVLQRLGLQNLRLPILLPGRRSNMLAVAPVLTPSDEKAVDNVIQLTNFLTGGNAESLGPSLFSPSMAQEVSSAIAQTQKFVIFRI